MYLCCSQSVNLGLVIIVVDCESARPRGEPLSEHQNGCSLRSANNHHISYQLLNAYSVPDTVLNILQILDSLNSHNKYNGGYFHDLLLYS